MARNGQGAGERRGTQRLAADRAGVAAAARLLRAGRLVAFPTETVYGIGADATDPAAVAGIYSAKGRPAENPLILHLADPAAAADIAALGPLGAALARAFWPGPLTLVAPLRPGAAIAPAVMAGGARIALRVPAHPVAQAFLRMVARPVAAPSANPSGRVSPTEPAHVLDPRTGLGGRIDAVLDGGACPVGLESTILAVEEQGLRLLRPGGLAVETIEAATGTRLAPADPAPRGTVLEAPGMMESHYAPAARLRLEAAAPEPGELWLGFGPMPAGAEGETLSATGDLDEAAARLFACLRRLDAAARPDGRIAVASVPDAGLGRAINDRLRRAAAPRPAPPRPAPG